MEDDPVIEWIQIHPYYMGVLVAPFALPLVWLIAKSIVRLMRELES